MRKESWPEILAAEIEGARKRPFSFGTHDCCAFAARVVGAMTGNDFMTRFPVYDEAGAQAVLDANGGVRGIATLCLGESIPALMAQRGDVVVVNTAKGEALGVCAGSVIVCAAADGITQLPLASGLAAWRVS